LITSGLMFGRKARLLVDLVRNSDDPKKDAILRPFNAIRGDAKRDIIAHGYIWSDANTVVFIERTGGGDYRTREYSFSLTEFGEHVKKFVKSAKEFYDAIGITQEEFDAFANAALSLERKAKTSPGAPSESA
jgi:hypothetical protein